MRIASKQDGCVQLRNSTAVCSFEKLRLPALLGGFVEGSEAPLVGGVDDGGVPGGGGGDGHGDRCDEEDGCHGNYDVEEDVCHDDIEEDVSHGNVEDVLDEKSSDIEVAVGAGVVERDEAALVLGVHVRTLGGDSDVTVLSCQVFKV